MNLACGLMFVTLYTSRLASKDETSVFFAYLFECQLFG